jgi:hypothetical protein
MTDTDTITEAGSARKIDRAQAAPNYILYRQACRARLAVRFLPLRAHGNQV